MEKIRASILLNGLAPEGFDAGDAEVSLVTTDSREVCPGCIFVAFPGERFDGHDFAAGTDLAVVVFGPHGREQGNAHKVFIPADVILTFHRYTVLYFLLYYTVPPCAVQDAVCKYLRRVASPPRR